MFGKNKPTTLHTEPKIFVRNFCTLYICLEKTNQQHLRSLHTEHNIFVWNFHTLKNRYDLTLCQSRLHTASETFVRHKKNSDRVWFSAFFHIIANILRGVLTVQSHRTSERQIQNGDYQVHPLRLAAQSTVYRSLHTEFTEIGGLLFNMWL